MLLDLREAALEAQPGRRGIAALDGFGAALPRLEDPPQLFLVAEMVRRLKRDIMAATNRLDAMRSSP